MNVETEGGHEICSPLFINLYAKMPSSQGRPETCRLWGPSSKIFRLIFKPLSLPTAKVRTFSDETLKFPKKRRFRKYGGAL